MTLRVPMALVAGFLSAAILAIGWTGGATAQGLSGSIGNLAVNSDAPIRIEADVLEIDEPQSTATFTGKVKATQDNMVLNTETLIVKYRAASGGEGAQLRSVDARGNVVLRVDDQTASGRNAHYDLAKEELILSGDIVLSQGDNVLRGERLVVDLKTGTANMVASTATTPGRVRAVIMPNRE